MATTVWDQGGATPKIWTETDWSIEVAKLGGPVELKWEQLFYESRFYERVPRLMMRIVRAELLDIDGILRADKDMQKVKMAQKQFEQSIARARPGARKMVAARQPQLVVRPAAVPDGGRVEVEPEEPASELLLPYEEAESLDPFDDALVGGDAELQGLRERGEGSGQGWSWVLEPSSD